MGHNSRVSNDKIYSESDSDLKECTTGLMGQIQIIGLSNPITRWNKLLPILGRFLVCVCVCVCVRARARAYVPVWTCVRMCVCLQVQSLGIPLLSADELAASITSFSLVVDAIFGFSFKGEGVLLAGWRSHWGGGWANKGVRES